MVQVHARERRVPVRALEQLCRTAGPRFMRLFAIKVTTRPEAKDFAQGSSALIERADIQREWAVDGAGVRTKLIVVSTCASAIHVWDLRTIRAGLKAIGRGSAGVSTPATRSGRTSPDSAPLRIELVGAESR